MHSGVELTGGADRFRDHTARKRQSANMVLSPRLKAFDLSEESPNDRAADGITRAAPFPAPPWRATTWDADRARALRDVERGAVPDRYREMIRAYFDPDDAGQHR